MSRAASLLGLFVWTALALSPQEFRFSRTLSGTHSQGKIAAVVLDSLVAERTIGNYDGVRLFSEQAEVVPCLVRAQTMSQRDTIMVPLSLERVSISLQSDTLVDMVYRRQATDSVPQAVDIGTTLIDFEKMVHLWGSNDSKSWIRIGEPQCIYDYSRFAEARSTRCSIPKHPWTYYRIVISGSSSLRHSPIMRIVSFDNDRIKRELLQEYLTSHEPFRLENIRFETQIVRDLASTARTTSVPLTIEKQTVDTTKNQTLITISAPAFLLTGISLTPNRENFRRLVSVYGTNDLVSDSFTTLVGSAELVNTTLSETFRNRLSISLKQGTRFVRYRLVVENNDNPPLRAVAISALVQREELLFIPPPGSLSLVLCYGHETVLPRPQYDLAHLLGPAAQVLPQYWEIGPLSINESVALPDTAILSTTPGWYRFLLPMALVAMIGVLVVVLAVVSKKIVPPPES